MITLTPHQRRQVCAEACVSEPPLERFLRGEEVRSTTRERIEHAMRRLGFLPPAAETILAQHGAEEPAAGTVRMIGAAVAFDPIQAAADALNQEVTLRAAAAKAGADELVQAVRSAVAKGVPIEMAARVLLKAAGIAAQKETQ